MTWAIMTMRATEVENQKILGKTSKAKRSLVEEASLNGCAFHLWQQVKQKIKKKKEEALDIRFYFLELNKRQNSRTTNNRNKCNSF